MNKYIIKIIILILLTASLTGCGKTTSEKSYWDSFKRSLSDTAYELSYDDDIEYALFSNNWMVRAEQRPRLAELLKRMIHKKQNDVVIEVLEGYYTFNYEHNGHRSYCLDIAAYCRINGELRWLFIDCGQAYVESKHLYLDSEWYLSLQDADKQDVQEPWAWCYYKKGEIEGSFWKPYFLYCSENYMYMENGVYLKSY